MAERRGSQRGKWLAKPVASAAFVAAALASGALESAYGRLVLLGLGLCLVGDVLLIPLRRPAVFRAGVFAFLAGHVAYTVAFLTQPLDRGWLVAGVTGLGLALFVVWGWLQPRLEPSMRGAVAAYLLVIGGMASFALAFTGAGGPATVAIGALAFTASDVAVARDRFVQEGFLNRAWGLPLYYAAQLLIASSPAGVAP